MDKLLSDPDLVDEARSYLGLLIRRIVLTADIDARHGCSAKLEFASDTVLPPQENGGGALGKSFTVEC